MKIGDGFFEVACLHLTESHLVASLTGHVANKAAFVVEGVIHECVAVILLLEIGIRNHQGQFPLTLFVGVAYHLRTIAKHRLPVTVAVVDLHHAGSCGIAIDGMVTKRLEITECLLIVAFLVLDVSIVILRILLEFPFVECSPLEVRQGLVELIELEVGVAHVELQLLSLLAGQRRG